jgi:hypothetical protein
MSANRKRKLGELLIDMGLVQAKQLEKAMEMQKQTGHKLGTCLIRLGFVSEKALVEALTSRTEIRSYVIGQQEIPLSVRSLIPVKKAFEWEVIPLRSKTENSKKYLTLGMTDPSNVDTIREVQFLTNHTVIPVFVGLEDLQKAYERLYGTRMELIRMDSAQAKERAKEKLAQTAPATFPISTENEVTLHKHEGADMEIVSMTTARSAKARHRDEDDETPRNLRDAVDQLENRVLMLEKQLAHLIRKQE